MGGGAGGIWLGLVLIVKDRALDIVGNNFSPSIPYITYHLRRTKISKIYKLKRMCNIHHKNVCTSQEIDEDNSP